jgi:branched-chain amino acid aminotransferase
MSDVRISIHRVRKGFERARPDPKKLGFGRFFADHYVTTDWTRPLGWHDARLLPLGPIALEPSASVLHYGQETFEGLKAYRNSKDQLFLFRWQKNAARMRGSCERLVMPVVDESLFGRMVKAAVLADRDWVPREPGCSLYIRPNLIASDPFLGVHAAEEFKFYVMTGPVGAYFPEGVNPVRIMVEEEDVRAVRGGLGSAKTAANYAHSLRAQARAAKAGFTQVLWLDAIERKWVEEVGTMNIAFIIKDELVTPPLGGTILAGVTRDSVLQLARRWGMKVDERPIAIDEVIEGAQSGALQECFGMGTAAVIAPVGKVSFRGREVTINDHKTGPVARRLYDTLTKMQLGEEEDPFGWVERVDQLELEKICAG